MNHFEIERCKFKPRNISLLFVAESPPQAGTFFYFRNSILYSAMLPAFQRVFPDIDNSNFLDEFKNRGCYLEDLCRNPVNHLKDLGRINARIAGIPDLADRIKEHEPKAIVILMKDIVSYVDEALKRTHLEFRFKVSTPFPVRSQSNFDNCVDGIEIALRKCLTLGLLGGN